MSFFSHPDVKKSIQNGFQAGILLLLIVLGIAIFTHRSQIADALTPKPETFTELYLENHLTLPKEATANSQHEFAFTVHNLEYKTIDYPIEVYAEDEAVPANTSALFNTTITLKHDESKTISVNPTFPRLGTEREKIVVNLLNKNQKIYFWVNIIASTSAYATPSAVPR